MTSLSPPILSNMPHATNTNGNNGYTNGTNEAYDTSGLKESQIDVLILGAGPAGVMSANGLARAGVKVRILDERSALLSFFLNM